MTTSANAPAVTEETISALSREQNEPQWLLQRRLEALRAYVETAMPDPYEEEWRRTDISGLDLDAALAVKQLRSGTTAVAGDSEGYGAVIVQDENGSSVGHRSPELPQGVVFTDLHTAAREHAGLLEERLHTLARPEEWKLSALQAGAWRGGAFLYVPRNVEVELRLRYMLSHSGGFLAPHLLVIADENSSVTIVQETFSADDGQQALVSGAVEIFCKADARVRFVETQRWGLQTYSFSTVRARLERGAELTGGLVGLGGRVAKTKLEVDLAGEGSRAELLGLSLGDGKQHFDYVTLQDHSGPRTSSDLLFKAALNGESSEVWYGKVRIRSGASQSQASQTSRNLLLSDSAKAAPIPVLEIEAYDVLRCSHGATAGPLDEDQRFYLESRGIPPAEAERLLVEAFFQEVLDRLPEAVGREKLIEAVQKKIGVAD
jgi:Fe-S cluster assembly protein SufD